MGVIDTPIVPPADETTLTRTGGTLSIKDSGVTSTKILDGTIVNADISATASISPTKIAGNIAVTPAFSSLGEGSTASTSMTTAKSVTIGGGYSGFRLIWVAWQGKVDGDVGAWNLSNTNNYDNGDHQFRSNSQTYKSMVLPLIVASGDVVTLQFKDEGGSGQQAFVKNFQIFTTAGDITFT